jgi:alkylation response protein AidB-like acyl-CoA dehydrogenase
MPHVPGLNLNLGETIDMLRDTVSAFAADEITPRAAQIERALDPHGLLQLRLSGLRSFELSSERAA